MDAPLSSLVLVASAVAISEIKGLGLGLSSQWVGIFAVLFGTLMVWGRSKGRYDWTHYLRWTPNSKRLNFAFAVVFAGLVVLAMSAVFLT